MEKEIFPEELGKATKYIKGINTGKKEIVSILNLFENTIKESDKKILFKGNIRKEGLDEFMIEKIEKHYQKLGLKPVNIKRILVVITEITQNGKRYGDKKYPVIVEIYETKEKIDNREVPYIYIDVVDKIREGEDEVRKLDEKLWKANNSSIEDLKGLYIKDLNEKDMNKDGGAGVGFWEMGRKAKIDDTDRPFSYKPATTIENGEEISLIKVTCRINASKFDCADKIGVKTEEDLKKEVKTKRTEFKHYQEKQKVNSANIESL